MYLIVGLGNPGRKYRLTRHNAGFMVVDRIAELAGIKIRGFNYKARVGKGKYKGQDLVLIKPRTYMNLSGVSVKAALDSLRIKKDNLLVVHDDLDLAPGRVKVKRGGGTGGHKGLASIMEKLGTNQFARVRIGIGKPGREGDTIDHVLETFGPEDLEKIKEAIEIGAEAALFAMSEGIEPAMNKFNSSKKE